MRCLARTANSPRTFGYITKPALEDSPKTASSVAIGFGVRRKRLGDSRSAEVLAAGTGAVLVSVWTQRDSWDALVCGRLVNPAGTPFLASLSRDARREK